MSDAQGNKKKKKCILIHFIFRVRPPPKVNWIQICILCIGVFIGVAGFIATITLCCLYSKYKRRIRRSNIKIVEAPVRALIPASLPPG